jgi:hypothetical protein
MSYQPYKTDYLFELMKYFYGLGWYGGERNLFTITMQGEFEGYSGKASETWEHRFRATNCPLPEQNIVRHEVWGETMDDACKKLLQALNNSIPISEEGICECEKPVPERKNYTVVCKRCGKTLPIR